MQCMQMANLFHRYPNSCEHKIVFRNLSWVFLLSTLSPVDFLLSHGALVWSNEFEMRAWTTDNHWSVHSVSQLIVIKLIVKWNATLRLQVYMHSIHRVREISRKSLTKTNNSLFRTKVSCSSCYICHHWPFQFPYILMVNNDEIRFSSKNTV